MVSRRTIFAVASCAILAWGDHAQEHAASVHAQEASHAGAAAQAADIVQAQSAAEAHARAVVARIEHLAQGLTDATKSQDVAQTEIERGLAAESDASHMLKQSEAKSNRERLRHAHHIRLKEVRAQVKQAMEAARNLNKVGRRTEKALRHAGEHERVYEGAYSRAEDVSERLELRVERAGDQADDMLDHIYEQEIERESKRAREQRRKEREQRHQEQQRAQKQQPANKEVHGTSSALRPASAEKQQAEKTEKLSPKEASKAHEGVHAQPDSGKLDATGGSSNKADQSDAKRASDEVGKPDEKGTSSSEADQSDAKSASGEVDKSVGNSPSSSKASQPDKKAVSDKFDKSEGASSGKAKQSDAKAISSKEDNSSAKGASPNKAEMADAKGASANEADKPSAKGAGASGTNGAPFAGPQDGSYNSGVNEHQSTASAVDAGVGNSHDAARPSQGDAQGDTPGPLTMASDIARTPWPGPFGGQGSASIVLCAALGGGVAGIVLAMATGQARGGRSKALLVEEALG